MTAWFDVDRGGLAKLLERRGKGWILAELIQNAWDAPGVSEVSVKIEPEPGRALANVRIEDDSPTGFSDLAHSFTLFAESAKKTDSTARGRFNLGEKLVLALCDRAEIHSTTGMVVFDAEGRREHPRRKREAGTTFTAEVRMTRQEIADALKLVRGFIPPSTIRTTVNGVELAPRQPLRALEARLETEIADENGVLRRSRRKAPVTIYQPIEGEPGRIYEMGIPVMETGDTFDVDIGQKVPLGLERDAVSPAFLRDVRVAVLNSAVDLVTSESASQPWVQDALDDKQISSESVADIVKKRWGDKVVSYDPSDREANDRAVARGYTVLMGGSLSKAAWANVRETGFVRPAGQVAPTPKPFSPDGRPAEHVEMTPSLEAFKGLCETLGRELLGKEIRVQFYKSFNALAAYGDGGLYFNVGRLGRTWFEGPLNKKQVDLIVHEFGHEYEANHLSDRYNDALTRLAGQCVMLALEKPHVFDLDRYASELEEDAAPAFGR